MFSCLIFFSVIIIYNDELVVLVFTADEGHEETDQQHKERKVFSDDELSNIVDLVLQEDDLDKDGYIEYVEFVTAQRKAREQAQNEKPQQ